MATNTNLPRSGVLYQKPPQDKVEMQQLWRVMDDLQNGIITLDQAINAVSGSLSGYVQSVTGLDTDNTDPQNPVVNIAVDGVTITGDGTSGNPLVASGSGIAADLLSPLLLMGG